jgi:hypothetical protein
MTLEDIDNLMKELREALWENKVEEEPAATAATAENLPTQLIQPNKLKLKVKLKKNLCHPSL